MNYQNRLQSLLIILLILTTTIGLAQKQSVSRVDSLLRDLKNCKSSFTIPSIRDSDKVIILNHLSFEYCSKNPDSALKFGLEALHLSEKISWQKGVGSSFHQIGWACYNKGDYEQSLDNYRKAIDVWEIQKIKCHKEDFEVIRNKESSTLGNIGISYMTTGDYGKAIDYFLRALKISEETEKSADTLIEKVSKNERSRHLGNLGIVYFSQGDFPKALDYYLKALHLNETIGNKQKIVANMANIGAVYLSLGNYSTALDYYLNASKLNSESGDKSYASNIMGNIGNAYFNLKAYDKAREFFIEALKLDDEIGNKSGVAKHISNIGSVYSIQGYQFLANGDQVKAQQAYAEAFDCFFKALLTNKELGEKKTVAINLFNIGNICFSEKKYSKAEKYYLESLTIADSIGDLTRISDAYQSLSKVYTQTNQYKKALAYYQKAMVAKDSLFNEEKTQEITRKEMNYEFEKKEALVKAEQEKRDSITRTRFEKEKLLRNSIAGGSGILIVSSLLSFFFYKRKRDAEQRQKEIALNLQVSETEMKALRSQMNPHFIFNALQSIQGFLMNHQSDEANVYLLKFSKLMRAVLENSQHREVSLQKDIQALELYMQLESIRLPHPFTYQFHVEESIDVEETTIPPLILQPFVENAIWHGLQYKLEPGHINIYISQKDNALNAIVEDNGVGRDMSHQVNQPMLIKKKSMGMKLTEERLKILNELKKIKAQFKITDLFTKENVPTGTRVELSLPLVR